MNQPDNHVTIDVRLCNRNYELLYSAAAFQGESLETAINRACALYEALHRAEPGTVVSWVDTDGNDRDALILPAEIPFPFPFGWMTHQIRYRPKDNP